MSIRRTFTAALVASVFASTSAIAAPILSATTTAQPPTTASPTTSTSSSFSPQQVQDIQKIIHDYLVNNPQVLVEASKSLEAQTEQQEQSYAQKAIKENVPALFNDPTSPVAGNAYGNVNIVEFFDYQCGHCKAMNTIVQNILKQNTNLRIVFKELPIFGSESQFAAKAALASVKQGQYLAFHDALLSADNPLTNDKVFQIAKSVGLNVNELKKAMNNPEIQAQLTSNFKLAQALHLIGTPTFVMSNKALTEFKFVPGATSEQNLQSLIDQLSK